MQAVRPALAELWERHSDGFSCLEPVRGEGGKIRDFRFVYVNPAGARMVGKQQETLIDRDLLQEFPMLAGHWAQATTVLETGEPWTLGPVNIQERRLQATLSRFGDGLAVIVNDITQMTELQSRVVALEELVERARSDTAQAKALFDTIFDLSPIGYAVLDRSHRFVAVNKALLSVLPSPVPSVIGKTVSDLWPDYACAIEPIIGSVLLSGEPRLGNEIQIRTPAGNKHLLFGTYPIRTSGEILGTGTFVLDMTDRKQVEEFQQQIMGIVGHDLRSPLQAVLIGAQGLLRQQRVGEDQRSTLLRIQRCARRMTRLIDDLADFTRMRVGQPIAINIRPTNIDEVCRQAVGEMDALYPGRSLSYAGQGNPQGFWDSSRLVQVLTNLISNAFKYSPSEAQVDLVWWRESDSPSSSTQDVVIEVRNSGTPIDPTIIPYIFEPFRRGQTRDPLAQASLGLGLYIVRYFVEAHGGSVHVRSDAHGTVFSVRLPSVRPVTALPRPMLEAREPLIAFRESQQGRC